MELTKAASWPEQTKSYMEDVKAGDEARLLAEWPQVRATTGVVIAAVFLFAAYFAVVDASVNSVINKLISSFHVSA